MKKAQAIRMLNSKFRLNSANCNFSKINKAVPLWWLNIRPEKFKNDLYIILDEKVRILLLLIPGGTFYPPEDHFYIRKDKNVVDLRISSVKNEFYLQDLISGGTNVKFKPYLVHIESVAKDYLIPELPKPNLFSDPREVNSSPPAKPHQIILKKNQTGTSYNTLFSNYLKGATQITLQDPYIRLRHQFENLLEFCMMLEKNKKADEKIHLKVVTWNDPEYHSVSVSNFEDLKTSVSLSGINLEYDFQRHHDRYIQADNGWKITLGRGLDIFEKPESQFSIAVKDQTKRKCKGCEMTYLRV